MRIFKNVNQDKKIEQLEKEIQFHKGYCLRFSDKIKILEEENERLKAELQRGRAL